MHQNPYFRASNQQILHLRGVTTFIFRKIFMNNLFIEADKEIKKFLVLIKEGQDLFPTTYVSADLLKKGFVQYNGVIVPLDKVSYKFLFDYYHKAFLSAYITFFERLWEERNSLTNEFALRAILEMGIENSFIIFDRRVENNDKKLYLTILLLTDYSSIETSMKSLFYGWFNRLLNENEEFLHTNISPKEWKIISDLKDVVKDSFDKIKYRKAIKKARSLLSNVKYKILEKYTKKNIYIETENYKGIKSGESHTLHGNIFLIIHRLNQKSQENHLFRVYSYLFISGIEMLKRLSDFHNDKFYKEEALNFIDNHSKFKIKLIEAWKSS